MLEEKKMERLNELGRKCKTEELTANEAEEQQLLREEYLTVFRERFRSQLDSIHIEDEEDGENDA